MEDTKTGLLHAETRAAVVGQLEAEAMPPTPAEKEAYVLRQWDIIERWTRGAFGTPMHRVYIDPRFFDDDGRIEEWATALTGFGYRVDLTGEFMTIHTDAPSVAAPDRA